MAQVSIGQVDDLEDLVQGLLSAHDALEAACKELIAFAEGKCSEAQQESQVSATLLDLAIQQEHVAQVTLTLMQQHLIFCESSLAFAISALSTCLLLLVAAQPTPSLGCSSEKSEVDSAQGAVQKAQVELERAQAEFQRAQENRQAMERRSEKADQAFSMAQNLRDLAQQECAARLSSVSQVVNLATGRLTAAQNIINAYLAENPAASLFHSWLHWNPAHRGGPITPDMLRERMNLSMEQQAMLQDYLYCRNATYRGLVDKYRSEWASAKGDVERNMVARKVRIHLSGQFGEAIALQALAPLGQKIETQGRSFVGDSGRYTKTDLIVRDLHTPVILGRGEGMGAPVGGSMAFEVKCGKADYLYSQKDHMIFQSAGHKQADAHCTLCSRDIHDLAAEQGKELREAMRGAGSPLVGLLPLKNEIDQSCLKFIQQGKESRYEDTFVDSSS